MFQLHTHAARFALASAALLLTAVVCAWLATAESLEPIVVIMSEGSPAYVPAADALPCAGAARRRH